MGDFVFWQTTHWEAAFFCISIPSLFVLCCWCWCFGSHFDPLLLFRDTSDRTSSLPVRAPWQASLWLPINDCRERQPIFSSSPMKTNHLLLDYLNMRNCNRVVPLSFSLKRNNSTRRGTSSLSTEASTVVYNAIHFPGLWIELPPPKRKNRTKTHIFWHDTNCHFSSVGSGKAVWSQNRLPKHCWHPEENISGILTWTGGINIDPLLLFSLCRVFTSTHI